SVLRVDALGTATLRRSRGYVPDVLPLAADGATVLATGSYLKNAPALLYGNAALPGAHVGDLAHPAACVALEHAITALQLHSGHAPQAIACDNGEHLASQLAAQLASAAKVPLLRVGHHHAHIGAVCAEHLLHGPVLGLALDGHGVGDDGGAWGGELLLVNGAHSQRIGHLAPLALPGCDAAARQPWRVAAAWLLQHDHANEAERRFGHQPAWPLLGQQLARGINTPYSSSMGRYFDLVAALAGVCLQQGYEGEAPQRLQALARPAAPLAGGWHIDAANVLQLTPLLQQLLTQPDAAAIASLWHATLAAALASWVLAAAQHHTIRTVALGGGCFANRTLLAALLPPLQQAGLAVYHPQALPAGDGGLAVGQAWVARQILANKETDPCAWPCR
ncbi:MAG: carbamoyltransferase HypF, partial [Vogesella sp.]|uniref:Kae1-like domain-containing protein n=1 Tax=Vogesella sp. TaxID=1904252 RepID=UPI003F394FDF